MKKSLLALAVLGAFAGAASAQSSVTVYGKVDMGLGKTIASEDKQVRDAAGSRLGFRGVEDLGGGLAAVFGFEHRFNPDTGTDATGGSTFWNGYSNVGLRGGFGAVTLGRHYTAAFTDIQNQIDPFGGDTVAALRGVGIIPGSGTGANAAIAKVRVADSIRYDIAAAGFKVAATIAEATQPGCTTACPDRPFSVAGSYAGGPLFVGFGYENPQGANDKIWTLGGRYTFAPVTLRAGFSSGTNNASNKLRSFLVGASIKVGAAGDILAGYAVAKNRTTNTDISKRLGLGYRHNLSKRTFLYADFARESVNAAALVAGSTNNFEKNGYDFGIQHNF
jgi:predicted porin